MAFFFKLFPEIIQDGRLFIAEPPLYRVDDKKNPFVINKEDYVNRYVQAASKDYKLGYKKSNDDIPTFVDKNELAEFLTATSSYVDDINMLHDHYKINERLLELIIEEFALMNYDPSNMKPADVLEKVNIQHLMDRIGTEFPEVYYDDNDKLIKGVIDGKYQLTELSEQLVRKTSPLISLIREWGTDDDSSLVLRDNKTGTEHNLSMLGVLKILKKYQPNILHRFKGLNILRSY